MESKFICGMTMQLYIDCSRVVPHISREFSHNLFHVPPLFQPSELETEANCTIHGEKWKRRNWRCSSECCSRHHLCVAESFVQGSIYPGSCSLSCQPLGIIIHSDKHIIKPGVSELMNYCICE